MCSSMSFRLLYLEYERNGWRGKSCERVVSSALESKPPNLPHYIAPGLIKICDKLKSFKGKYRRSVLQKSPKAFDLQCFDQTFHR